MADKVLQLSVKVNAETGELEVLGAKLKETGKAASETGDSFSGLTGKAATLLKGFLGLAAAKQVFDFFSMAVQGAEEEVQALKRLDHALAAHGSSLKANQTQVESWASAIQKQTRFSDGEAVAALERMVRVTGDLTQAQGAVQLAMGLSVRSGQDLQTVLGQVTDLMNGNERALIQMRREFGSFIGDATTTQEALSRLNAAFGTAAVNEDGLTASSARLRNALGELGDQLGVMFIPFLTRAAEMATTAVQKFNNLALTIVGVSSALERVAAVDFAGAWAAIDQMRAKMAELHAEETSNLEQTIELRARKTEQDTRAREQEIEEQTRQAQVLEQIELELNQRIASFGDDTFAKKRQQAELEYQARRAKINKEVNDEKAKEALLRQNADVRLAHVKKIDTEEVRFKRDAALQVLDFSAQALSTLNSMGDLRTREDARRAKILLALEKAIAIARIWSAEAAKGVAGIAIASAATGLVVAQFAAQSKAIDDARQAASEGGEQFKISTDLPGGKNLDRTFTSDGDSGGGSLGSGPGGAFAPGGGGPTLVINRIEISIPLNIASLDISNVDQLMRRLTDALRAEVPSAVSFAIAGASLAEKFPDRAA
jgi:hypothetical protein